MDHDAVLFDMDGVLLRGAHTPREVYAEATREAFAALGVESPDETAVDAFVSPAPRAALAARCAEHGVRLPDLWAEREARASRIENERIGTTERTLYDDVEELEALAERAALGVVSNNRHATVEHVVDAFDLDGLLSVAHGREPTLDGYARRKPDPYLVERAIAELDAETPLYVGDRAKDVVAAEGAGADAALLVRPDRERPTGVSPRHEVTNLTELREALL